LRELGCGTRIVCLGDDLVLPGLDEDDSRDQDDQYRDNEGNKDGSNGHITYASFRRGIAWCRLLVIHGLIGCRSDSLGLDGRSVVRGGFVAID
jgi:hypothetical protein